MATQPDRLPDDEKMKLAIDVVEFLNGQAGGNFDAMSSALMGALLHVHRTCHGDDGALIHAFSKFVRFNKPRKESRRG